MLTEQSLRSRNGRHGADRDQDPSDRPPSTLCQPAGQEQTHTRTERAAGPGDERNLRNRKHELTHKAPFWSKGSFRSKTVARHCLYRCWTCVGLWTAQVSRNYALTLPAVLLAIPLGRMINTRLDPRRFLVVILAGLLASGVALLLHAMLWS
jgi:hypothetical protein